MRDILYRGKTIDGKWYIGFLTQYHPYLATIRPLTMMKEYKVIPETVGEFTGQKDKIDKPIFEEDIIFIPREVGLFKRDVIGLVTYDNCVYWVIGLDTAFSIGLNTLNTKLINVIGNKHDNPEFFTGKKND
jgi:hypothetical protein